MLFREECFFGTIEATAKMSTFRGEINHLSV
jgi:hypothetical protein